MLAASAVFLEIGRKLSAQREVLGLSLQDVERHTHLRNHYLRALEAGDLKGLPSPVQGRGMLANYATFLGLNPEPLLLRFAEGLQGVLVAKQAAVASKPKPARPRPARQGIRMDLLLGAMALVLVVGFVIWGAFRVFSIRAEVNDATRTPSPPPISEVLASGNNPPTTPAATGPAVTLTLPAGAVLPGVEITSTITSTLTTGSITGTASIPGSTQAALPPPPGNSALQVYVVIQQPAWMRVTVDGEVAFEGRVRKGAAFSYEGDSYIDILTGNGAGVQVFFNQVDLGLLGALGEVVDRVFTPQGIFTPTPTITPTPRPVTPTPVGPTATSTQVMIMP
jgi:cytoskeleton protein RodZ